MGTCRPWEIGTKKSSLYLTVRFLLAGRGVTVRVPLLLLALMPFLLWFSFQKWQANLLLVQAQQTERLAELEQKNEQLQSFLARKEKEREQMVALAEARSSELWRELEARDQELEKLWKLVGQERGEKRASRPEQRKSLSGSRAGSDGNSLAVKMRYRQLIGRFQEKDREMESLGAAAQAYRQQKYEEYQRELASRTPSIWPSQGRLSSGFGYRIHPVYGGGRHHSGCDITAPEGTPILATAAGVVVTSGWMGGYGQTIEIDHGNGLKTLYGHCSELLVPVGASVSKGQLIARVGSTGVSTGPHVHYEVKKNETQIDPAPYLKEKEAPRPLANT